MSAPTNTAPDRARLVAEARDALDGIDRNAHGELEGVGRMERAIDALNDALEAADADARAWRAFVAMFPDQPLASNSADNETITRGELVDLLQSCWSAARAAAEPTR